MITLLLALVFLLLAAATLFFALFVSRNERRSLEERLKLVFAGFKPLGPAEPGQTAEQDRAAERLRRVVSLGLPHTWGTHASSATLLLIALAGAVCVWLLTTLPLQLPHWIAALASLGALLLLPRLVLAREQSKAEKRFTNLFPDAIDMAVRMLRAGIPISATIRTIGEEAAPPVGDVFKTMADQVAIGIPFEEALATTGQQVGLPDFRIFAIAVALQRATGGNLATTLEILSDIMRKRRTVRLRGQATTAEVRVSAYILSAIPFFVTGILLVIQPGYLAPLVTDPRGKIILASAAASLALGLLTMRRMMQRAIRM